MPAMKPSTTSRARTSRCARRATPPGSRNARPPAAPRATPRSGWAPERERGNDALMARSPASSILPRGPYHLVGVALEGPSVEATQHLVAGEARGPEQQLHLVTEGPAQREAVEVDGL